MADGTGLPTLSPVIVTGGCGFIGSHLVEGLLKADASWEIHVIDLSTDRNRFPGVIYHDCDITNVVDVEAVFINAKPKTVFHVACPDPLVLNPSRFRHVNVDGTHNLLISARKIKTVQAFVYTSTSSAVHDNVSNLVDADETFPVLRYPQQKRVYTLTKIEAEAEVLATNRQDGDSSMLTVSVRPTTAFGERDYGFLGKVVASCRAGKANMQIGPGKNYYDFIYVSNLVDGHILAAQALVRAWGRPAPKVEDSERVDGQAFIFTNDERMLFWDFHRAIAKSVGIEIKQEDVRIVPRWVAMLVATIRELGTWILSFGTRHASITREAVHLTTITRTLNCERAKRVLGYSPKISIQDGLERAGSWFVEEAKQEMAKKTI